LSQTKNNETVIINNVNETKKKLFEFPHAYVILLSLALFVALLSYIVPAGSFDRVVDAVTKKTLVLPGSYHQIAQTPVQIGTFVKSIHAGFVEAAYLIFFIFFAYFYIFTVLKSGSMNGAIRKLIEVTKDRVELVIPIFMIFFGVLGTTCGSFEATYGLIPVFVGIAIALGYDAIVGLCMVEMAVLLGYSTPTINPFTLGLAQTIAELPLFSGLGFRIFAFIITISVGIWFTMRYAKRIKANPKESLVYGMNFGDLAISKDDLMNAPFNIRNKIIMSGFIFTMVMLAVGALKLKWYISEFATLFLVMGVINGLIAGWRPSKIADIFVEACAGMVFGAFVVGVARSILLVMNAGNITDTIIYSISQPLQKLPSALTAQGMLIVQTIINFFISSGSGQAATIMPLMTPLSDLVGVNRQVAVLAFNFGDGVSNLFWPTNQTLIFCAIAKIPFGKWYKFFLPLAGILIVTHMILLGVAQAINLGPF